MYLTASINITYKKRPGHSIIFERAGQLITGEIERVTRTKRTIVKSQHEQHVLKRRSIFFVFTEEKQVDFNIESVVHLKAFFPHTFLEAYNICLQQNVQLNE